MTDGQDEQLAAGVGRAARQRQAHSRDERLCGHVSPVGICRGRRASRRRVQARRRAHQDCARDAQHGRQAAATAACVQSSKIIVLCCVVLFVVHNLSETSDFFSFHRQNSITLCAFSSTTSGRAIPSCTSSRPHSPATPNAPTSK